MRAGARSGTRSRSNVVRKRLWASFDGGVAPPGKGLPGSIGSSGTQIQWPRQRISGKSCGVTAADVTDISFYLLFHLWMRCADQPHLSEEPELHDAIRRSPTRRVLPQAPPCPVCARRTEACRPHRLRLALPIMVGTQQVAQAVIQNQLDGVLARPQRIRDLHAVRSPGEGPHVLPIHPYADHRHAEPIGLDPNG